LFFYVPDVWSNAPSWSCPSREAELNWMISFVFALAARGGAHGHSRPGLLVRVTMSQRYHSLLHSSIRLSRFPL
jgi:hypothetical protein